MNDVISVINAIKDVPTDKFVIFFLLIGGGYLVWKIIQNNTTAIKNNTLSNDKLSTTLQTLITNQKLHDERNKSDFRAVKLDISNVRGDVSRVERDVSCLADDVNDITARMATKDELQSVSDAVATSIVHNGSNRRWKRVV